MNFLSHFSFIIRFVWQVLNKNMNKHWMNRRIKWTLRQQQLKKQQVQIFELFVWQRIFSLGSMDRSLNCQNVSLQTFYLLYFSIIIVLFPQCTTLFNQLFFFHSIFTFAKRLLFYRCIRNLDCLSWQLCWFHLFIDAFEGIYILIWYLLDY